MRLRDWLREGPVHIRLSSGFFGFYAHAGVMRALEEEQISIASLGGSSSGALTAGLYAAGLRGQAFETELTSLRRDDFWDPGIGLGLLRGQKLRTLLESKAPVKHIERCTIPLAVSVFDMLSLKTRVLREGPLVPAIQASAALPGMFQPVWFKRRPMLDGGILDRTSLETAPPPGARLLFHHLTPSKRWHRAGAAVNFPPQRPGMVRLSLDDLPRINPYRLERGAQVFERAVAATRAALDLPLLNVMRCSA
ncbi:MAG: patatin-like phospholipase family protein [Myxococcota bacterium]